MKIEEINKKLDNLHKSVKFTSQLNDLSYIRKNVDSMHNLLTEFAEYIDNGDVSYGMNDLDVECLNCRELNGHKEDCIVLKAQQYLQDTKEKS